MPKPFPFSKGTTVDSLSTLPINTGITTGSGNLYSVQIQHLDQSPVEPFYAELRPALGRVHSVRDISTRWGPTVHISIDSTHTVSLDTVPGHPDGIPIARLGWSTEEAREIRQSLSILAEDWDEAELDAYNVYLKG